jgi:catechol-2,3-dioxygenase
MEILEIKLNTDDIISTEAFYTNILEFKLIKKSEKSISFLVGNSILSFIKSENLQPKYHFAFNIPNNKLEEAINWISKKLNLIKIDNNTSVADFESWNAKAIYFYDNNENILEFIARFDLESLIENQFDTSSILSISEIGVVTNEPLNLSKKISENYNLNLFEKGVQSVDFASLGDDNGLIILVKPNRKWYPTNQKAEKHFVEIKLISNGLTNEIIINDENSCS